MSTNKTDIAVAKRRLCELETHLILKNTLKHLDIEQIIYCDLGYMRNTIINYTENVINYTMKLRDTSSDSIKIVGIDSIDWLELIVPSEEYMKDVCNMIWFNNDSRYNISADDKYNIFLDYPSFICTRVNAHRLIGLHEVMGVSPDTNDQGLNSLIRKLNQ